MEYIWNNCIKLIARSETLTTIKISKFKKDLKKLFLKFKMLSIMLDGIQICYKFIFLIKTKKIKKRNSAAVAPIYVIRIVISFIHLLFFSIL